MSRIATRIGLATLAVGAAVSGSALLAPAANADQATAVQLAPGQSVCLQQYAGYQVRAEGTSRKPIHFRVLRNGSPIYSAPGSTAFAAEFRSAWGNFPGPATYSVCAVNNTTVSSQVTVRLRTDGEI